MKRLIELILLSVCLFSAITISAQNMPNSNLRIAFPVSEGITTSEPMTMPENFTESYINTTNPCSDIISPMSALGEIDKMEAHHPIYVLVAGDEEERQIWRVMATRFSWKEWAELQIERGDEALVANFGKTFLALNSLGGATVAIALPEVQEIFRKRGWKLPEP